MAVGQHPLDEVTEASLALFIAGELRDVSTDPLFWTQLSAESPGVLDEGFVDITYDAVAMDSGRRTRCIRPRAGPDPTILGS
jgi:hypothetical protein